MTGAQPVAPVERTGSAKDTIDAAATVFCRWETRPVRSVPRQRRDRPSEQQLTRCISRLANKHT